MRTLGQGHIIYSNTLRSSGVLVISHVAACTLSYVLYICNRPSRTWAPLTPPSPCRYLPPGPTMFLAEMHTVRLNSPGYECTDKVYSPAAPSTSDMQKIVMPDLFDMKRWERNITAGNVWYRWTSSVTKTWKGTTEQGCLMCSTGTSYCILMYWKICVESHTLQ